MIQTIYDQLVIFAFLQSIFLLVVLLAAPKYRRHVNLHMIILIMALAIGLGGKLLYMYGAFGGTRRLVMMSEMATLMFGSSLFLFAQSHLYKKPISKEDWLHYLPVGVYMLFFIAYFFIPSREVLVSRSQSGELLRVVYLFHAVGLVVNLFYWIRTFMTYKDFLAQTEDITSYAVQSRFFKILIVLTGICWVLWLAIYIISFVQTYAAGNVEMGEFEIQMRLFIWLAIGFIVLFLSFYGVVNPQVFQGLPDISPQKYAQSKYSANDLDQLKLDLEKIMIEKKPYLNKKLLKSELAELMGIASPELARLLNERIGMNFFDFVNYYRIKEFKKLSQGDQADSYTFFGLAQEAGFNSKTTFNKSFKKLMGVSPSQYFKNENI